MGVSQSSSLATSRADADAKAGRGGASGARRRSRSSRRFAASSSSSAAPNADPDLQEAQNRAELRTGHIPTSARYHRLPRRLEDDYSFQGKPLGSGYNGTVYSGTHIHTRTPVAIKSFSLKGVTPAKKKELIGEVEIFLALDHPHVARLMEVYESDAHVHVVMELMSGGELLARVIDKGHFSEAEGAEAARQMLLAISYLHNEGVVHRDLKMENFLYDRRGSSFLKIIDFGFSKFFDKGNRKRMVESLGTVSYVAPEVIAKSYKGGSCDMWSFGVIVFAMLSGYMPFSGTTNNETLRKIRSGKFDMFPSHWDHISDEGVDFVKRLLVVDPSARMTPEQALAHPWITRQRSMEVPDSAMEVHADRTAALVAEGFASYGQASPLRQASLQLIAWSLSLDDRRRLRRHFLALDKEGSGVIKIGVLEALLRERHQERLTEAELRQVIAAVEALDIDADGELHYSDFLAAILATEVENHDCAMMAAFAKFDINGTGFATCDRIRQVLGGSMTSDEIRRSLMEAGADMDHGLTADEFFSIVSGRTWTKPLPVRSAGSSQPMDEHRAHVDVVAYVHSCIGCGGFTTGPPHHHGRCRRSPASTACEGRRAGRA